MESLDSFSLAKLDGMEGAGEFRCWEGLIPDALGLIFSHLSLQEILTVIPRVCKSWAAAVSGPYCWQVIDIEEWSLNCNQDNLDRMLEMLVLRSSGSVRRLCSSALQDERFSFITDHSPSLETLRMPRSEISDSIVEQVAGKLSNLTHLDISHCCNIGPRALESFGKNCKSLVRLKRTMHPLEVAHKPCQDEEAYAIAAAMPKLKHLELSYLHLTTAGALAILSNCLELELLDVRGCWEVKLDDEFLKEKFAGLKILGPLIVDCCQMNFWDDCSQSSDSSDGSWYYWDELQNGGEDDDVESFWGEERALAELEVRFYQGFNDTVAAGFDWPPSP